VASYSYVLKMVVANSSETLMPNTILGDAKSRNTVFLKRAALKLLQRHSYKGRCDEIRNVISYRPTLGKFMFRILAGTRVTLTSFYVVSFSPSRQMLEYHRDWSQPLPSELYPTHHSADN